MKTPDKDGFDLWLDGALRQEGDVEPGAGLEGRILANLHSREEHARTVRKWILLLGSPVLATLFVVLVWRGERTNINPPNLNSSNPRQSGVEQAIERTPQAAIGPKSRDTNIARVNRHRISARAQRMEPRLEQFPSPRPLSQEETQAAKYASRFPRDASRMAQEQQQFEDEIQQAELDLKNGTGVQDKQER